MHIFFLGIIGFIGIVLIVVTGITLIGLSTVQNEYSDFQNLPFRIPFVLIGVFYLLMAALYFIPSFNLIRFGSKIKSAFEMSNQAALDEGLKNLKRLFTFLGIMTIIVISLSFMILPVILIVKALTMM